MNFGAPPIAGAIDLGSTKLKAGAIDAEGRLLGLRSCAAPGLSGIDGVREGDAAAYAAVADDLLAWLAATLPAGAPLGLAAQRSTFLLWDRDSGSPLTPMISWQDRRAADWCDRNAGWSEEIARRTGLVQSAHYVGPKLGCLLEGDRDWRRLIARETTLLGTLDSYLVWRWSEQGTHETDLTMAARTLMLDLNERDWSDELLARYGVPRAVLPAVRSTTEREIPVSGGLVVRAAVADQAAVALTLFDPASVATGVNLGTGAFVLRPARGDERVAGYLTAPILSRRDGTTVFALEGTINGAGSAVDRFGEGPTVWPDADPTPDGFCIPDAAGLGAPYWQPEIGFTFSDDARRLDDTGSRRVTLEGLLFRIRQVVADLCAGRSPEPLIVAGGLSREKAVSTGLAAILASAVEVLESHEAALIGAARLAGGLPAHGPGRTRRVVPGRQGSYLAAKYRRWLVWLEQLRCRLGDGPE